MRHWITRKPDKLRLVIELPLGEALGAQDDPARREAYAVEVARYLARVADDALDVAAMINTEPEHGVVKWFDDAKGYGFIRTYDRQDVFVHHTQITGPGEYKQLHKGQRVQFKRRTGERSIEALEVSPEEDV